MTISPKRLLSSLVLFGLAASLAGCGSNKIAMRGCDLDHPYHTLVESQPLVAPEGLEVPLTGRTYQLPDKAKLAEQPSKFLTPGDIDKLDEDNVAVTDCLSHPPRYDTPVSVEGQDLSDVKAPRKQRKIRKSDDSDDDIGGARGGSRGPQQQGSGYPR
ncbi:MAG: hypothetical protein ACI91G_000332 [Gammaproteobacteria bacterium]|jgi:hypothetical protein